MAKRCWEEIKEEGRKEKACRSGKRKERGVDWEKIEKKGIDLADLMKRNCKEKKDERK